jgi:hypothetical protein
MRSHCREILGRRVVALQVWNVGSVWALHRRGPSTGSPNFLCSCSQNNGIHPSRLCGATKEGRSYTDTLEPHPLCRWRLSYSTGVFAIAPNSSWRPSGILLGTRRIPGHAATVAARQRTCHKISQLDDTPGVTTRPITQSIHTPWCLVYPSNVRMME